MPCKAPANLPAHIFIGALRELVLRFQTRVIMRSGLSSELSQAPVVSVERNPSALGGYPSALYIVRLSEKYVADLMDV